MTTRSTPGSTSGMRSRPARDVLDDVDQSYVRLAAAIDALPTEMVVERDVFPWLEGASIAEVDLVRPPPRRARVVDPRMAGHAGLTVAHIARLRS